MRTLVLLIALAACRSSSGGGSRTVTVTAFAGERPDPGARVIGHAADGSIIDQTTADAVGRADVGVDDDSFISVIFPGNLGSLTPVISVVTVPAPDAAIAVHGPPRDSTPPLIVGVLQVDGQNLVGAEYFDIRLGCASVRVTRLPATIDVGACSMGSDTSLDVLVAGYHDVGGDPPAPVLDGYAAGRIAMIEGVATLDIPAWQTTGTDVPVSLDGVSPNVELTLLADGLSFGTQTVTSSATVWTGLSVDATRVTASIPGVQAARVTTRETMGVPQAIAFGGDDFLPSIPVTARLGVGDPFTVTWDPAGIGDAVNLRTTWALGGALAAVPTGPHRVVWDAVLPTQVTSVSLPAFVDELATAIEPVVVEPTDVLLRYIDSVAHDGFAALAAAGIYAEETLQASTIAPRPANGEIRVTYAIGLR